MIFDDVRVKDIQVTFENKTLPENNDRIVKTDLEKVFISFLSASMKDEKCDIGTSLDFETFKKLYPIFYFDFTYSDEDDLFTDNLSKVRDFKVICDDLTTKMKVVSTKFGVVTRSKK